MHGSRSRRRALVVVLTTVAALLSAGQAAGAAPTEAPAAHVTTYEGFDYVRGPGGGLVLDWGFTPRHLSVPHGSVVRFTNTSTDGEPHTVSVARYAEVPKTIDEIFGCFAPGAFCDRTLAAHDPDGDHEPPFAKRVDVGRAGLDRQGDSRLLLPQESAYPTISAPAGTVLHYLCAIHPWMQATVKVT